MNVDKRRYLYVGIIIGLVLGIGLTASVRADEVRKSKSGICHCPQGQYYDSVSNFTEYKTIEVCLKSGGREPKNGQGICPKAPKTRTLEVPISLIAKCQQLYDEYDSVYWAIDAVYSSDAAVKAGCWIGVKP